MTRSPAYYAALDELTVRALYASSPPAVLIQHDRDRFDGRPVYDDASLVPTNPRAQRRRCADPQCTTVFWTVRGAQLYCCRPCCWRANARRRWRDLHAVPPSRYRERSSA